MNWNTDVNDDELQKSARCLINKAVNRYEDKAKDHAIVLNKDDSVKYQAQYNVDKVRPMYLGKDNLLAKFKVNAEQRRLINSEEESYSKYSSLILKSDIPYWINKDELFYKAVVKCDITPVLSDHKAINNLINFCQIKNYNELVEAQILPPPPDLSQDIANQIWQPDSYLLNQIKQNLNIIIKEHGSCCVPFAFTGEMSKDGHSEIYMPPSCIFDSEDAYYHTLFHEITHVQLVKDRSLQSAVIAEIASINRDQAERVKAKNEIAAELGASILLSVYKSGELPVELSDYSNAYMNSHGVFALTEDEHQEIVEATSLAVHHVLEAVPQIALHKDAPYQQEVSISKTFGNERERHVVIDADYEVLNQLIGSKSLVDAMSQQRLAHAELLLQQIKHQMKQMKRAELEQQAQARVQTQTERPAGKELAAAQPERGAKNTAQTPAKTSVSKPQPSKTKEPSKSRDMER